MRPLRNDRLMSGGYRVSVGEIYFTSVRFALFAAIPAFQGNIIQTERLLSENNSASGHLKNRSHDPLPIKLRARAR